MNFKSEIKRKAGLLLAAALLLGVVTASGQSAGTLDSGVETSCQQAEKFHLAAKLRYSQRDDQPFHDEAADAAKELGQSYGPAACDGWQDDAGPTIRTADGSYISAVDAENYRAESEGTK